MNDKWCVCGVSIDHLEQIWSRGQDKRKFADVCRRHHNVRLWRANINQGCWWSIYEASLFLTHNLKSAVTYITAYQVYVCWWFRAIDKPTPTPSVVSAELGVGSRPDDTADSTLHLCLFSEDSNNAAAGDPRKIVVTSGTRIVRRYQLEHLAGEHSRKALFTSASRCPSRSQTRASQSSILRVMWPMQLIHRNPKEPWAQVVKL